MPALPGGVHCAVRRSRLSEYRRFLRNGFVALAGQDVSTAGWICEVGSPADEAEVLRDARDFRHLIQTVGGVCCFSWLSRSAQHRRTWATGYGCRCPSAGLRRRGLVHLATAGGEALPAGYPARCHIACGEGGHQRLGGRVASGGAHRGDGPMPRPASLAFSRAIPIRWWHGSAGAG